MWNFVKIIDSFSRRHWAKQNSGINFCCKFSNIDVKLSNPRSCQYECTYKIWPHSINTEKNEHSDMNISVMISGNCCVTTWTYILSLSIHTQNLAKLSQLVHNIMEMKFWPQSRAITLLQSCKKNHLSQSQPISYQHQCIHTKVCQNPSVNTQNIEQKRNFSAITLL